jgi:hypothetical protein
MFLMLLQVKKSSQCPLRDKKHQSFSIVSLPTDSVIVDHAVDFVLIFFFSSIQDNYNYKEVIYKEGFCLSTFQKQNKKVKNIQGVSAKTFEPNISVIWQRIFMKFKM